jgi:ribonuclease HI
MIPAGVRLNLYQGRVVLPDEISIPLVGRDADYSELKAERIYVSTPEQYSLEPGDCRSFKIGKRPKDPEAELWVKEVNGVLPSIVKDKKGIPRYIKVTNTDKKSKCLPAFLNVGCWVEKNHLPWFMGYCREGSKKYKDWQVLVYEATPDKELAKMEYEIYSEWLKLQPAAVPDNKRGSKLPFTPTRILRRPSPRMARARILVSSAEKEESGEDPKDPKEEEPKIDSEEEPEVADLDPEVGFREELEETEDTGVGVARLCSKMRGEEEKHLLQMEQTREEKEEVVDPDPEVGFREESEEAEEDPEAGVARLCSIMAAMEEEENTYKHEAADLYAEDFAEQLMTIPDIVDLKPEPLDLDKADMCEPENTEYERNFVRRILEASKDILIASGNALPPTAKGVVCDIDVGDHPPIAQKARRIQIKYNRKLFELLKALLESQLIQYSKSQWASPIVIVLKKNGEDIRLCIDYRAVNLITKGLKYTMPLTDDLLSELRALLWACTLDNASGFWATEMTKRARAISAFVCALGHFEWRRMPFGLKNAPMIYQRMIDNALWGFVKPKDGWMKNVNHGVYQELLKEAEENLEKEMEEAGDMEGLEQIRKAKVEKPKEEEMDPQDSVNKEVTEGAENLDIFDNGVIDHSPYCPVFNRKSFIDDISFGNKYFWGCCITLIKLFARFSECRISVSLSKSSFLKKTIRFLSHEVSAEGIKALLKNLEEISKLEFPRSKKGMQSFLGSLNYYHKFIQDFPVYGAILYELQEEDFGGAKDLSKAKRAFEILKQKIVEAPILKHLDPEKEVVIMLYANNWAVSATIMQLHGEKYYPVRFVGRVLKSAEMNYQLAEKEILALLNVLKSCETLLFNMTLQVWTRFSTLKWLFTSKTTYGRAHTFATLLSPWNLEITRLKKEDNLLPALLTAAITPNSYSAEALEEISPEKNNKGSKEAKYIKPLGEDYDGYLLSFDGSVHIKQKGGDGAYAIVLWKLPEWSIVWAKGVYLQAATVNEAEYQGLVEGLRQITPDPERKIVAVGDSRLVIEQGSDLMQCHKENLQQWLTQLKTLKKGFKEVQLIHVPRKYNGSADRLASETLKRKESRSTWDNEELEALKELNLLREIIYEDKGTGDPTVPQISSMEAEQGTPGSGGELPRFEPKTVDYEGQVSDERMRRLARAQDEESRWRRIKLFLLGKYEDLDAKEIKKCAKIAEFYEIVQGEVLIFKGYNRNNPDPDPVRRVVVPQTLKEEILYHSHNTLEGGHQGVGRTTQKISKFFYWPGMHKDVEEYVSNCMDCQTGKGAPPYKGRSPGNLTASRPFQVVSMDFATQLPKTKRGNTNLFLLQCAFSGFVICKPMGEISAQKVAEAFNEKIYQVFGAPEVVRHDRDPRFMSDLFQAFIRMLGARSRATFSYRPQANGQQERSVQTIIRAIKKQIKEPDQGDWDLIAERLMFAINTSIDTVRKETPFFLVFGWDPRTTMQAMIPSKPVTAKEREPFKWRQQQLTLHHRAMDLAYQLQRKAKEKRKETHNDNLTERQKGEELESGKLVWLYVAKVKEGLKKKLAHLWHGPFRVRKKIDEHAVELDLPSGEDVRFFPQVHIARLKLVRQPDKRPEVEIEVDPSERFDFDTELLPEDSWVRKLDPDEYEVEKLLQERYKKKRGSNQNTKQYLVKWVGYDEPTWEEEENLNCPGLVYEFEEAKKREQRFRTMRFAQD